MWSVFLFLKTKTSNRFKNVALEMCVTILRMACNTKHISKRLKCTFPEQSYFPNTNEVDKEIEQLTPNKYSFGFIATQHLAVATRISVTCRRKESMQWK